MVHMADKFYLSNELFYAFQNGALSNRLIVMVEKQFTSERHR